MTHNRYFILFCLIGASLLLSALLGCGRSGVDGNDPVLKVGGIPDQNAARLVRRYEAFAEYLSEELGVSVKYVPSVDYAAVVTAFGQNQIQLAFFGGLTGVQARLQNPGARVIAQRETDAQFHSVFIVDADLPINSIDDLQSLSQELTITFGSESSTSGHLMPRHFLVQHGMNPDTEFLNEANFSGSHDLTWHLVQSGSFDVGALNQEVWDRAVREGQVDGAKVKEFYTTPAYFDYNWTAQTSLDKIYGDGFTNKVQAALLNLNTNEGKEILELFNTEKFITSNNANYQDIEVVARDLGIIR